MPIYEYLCERCGRITERMQKMSDPPLRACPECDSRQVAKLVSRTAFQLKGGGWYADLYSTAKKKDAKSGDSGAGTDKKASPPAGASDKPAAGEKPAATAKASTGQSDS